MSKVIGKSNGKITVNVPNEMRIEALLSLAEAQTQMAKTNYEIAKALNSPIYVNISNSNFYGAPGQNSPLVSVNTDDKQTHIVDIDDDTDDSMDDEEIEEEYENEHDEI